MAPCTRGRSASPPRRRSRPSPSRRAWATPRSSARPTPSRAPCRRHVLHRPGPTFGGLGRSRAPPRRRDPVHDRRHEPDRHDRVGVRSAVPPGRLRHCQGGGVQERLGSFRGRQRRLHGARRRDRRGGGSGRDAIARAREVDADSTIPTTSPRPDAARRRPRARTADPAAARAGFPTRRRRPTSPSTTRSTAAPRTSAPHGSSPAAAARAGGGQVAARGLRSAVAGIAESADLFAAGTTRAPGRGPTRR